MTARRLCVSAGLPAGGGRVVLDRGTAHHARVLRLREGDAVRLFDGRGAEADGRIVRADGDAFECDVGPVEQHAPAGARIVLVQCMAKGDKLDGIVRMATELGVAAIHLATSVRTVARPGAERASARVERLERVAQEAARQSARAHVPDLVAPAPLLEVAARAPAGAARLVPWERSHVAIEDVLTRDVREAWIVIGPEGGLDDADVDGLRVAGYADCTLGDTVLRVETAAPVAVALVRHVMTRG